MQCPKVKEMYVVAILGKAMRGNSLNSFHLSCRGRRLEYTSYRCGSRIQGGTPDILELHGGSSAI